MIDLLSEYIERPAASYMLSFVSSFASIMRHSFLSANRMVVLPASMLTLTSRMLTSDSVLFNSSIE